MIIDLSRGWQILQDVHDDCEALGLFRPDFSIGETQGAQLSEWEDLPELKQLQLIYAKNPYFGRELRYFNQAPWWYRTTFALPEEPGHVTLRFSNADYYCRVWLNGEPLGGHEGYSMPFSFDATRAARPGENLVLVKVWSPWDRQVKDGLIDKRTFTVERNMVKGTYEHSDTFVQRDMNPVGLYGSVQVEYGRGAWFEEEPEFSYALDDTGVTVHLSARIADAPEGTALRLRCIDAQTGECVGAMVGGIDAVDLRLNEIRRWSAWDRDGAWLYRLVVEAVQGETVLCAREMTTGFRSVELLRNESRTEFWLNGRRIYVRGTSYFPDAYVSGMTEARYRRDLANIRALGFNLIRVHVHVEQRLFYELCDELGLMVMQDSEYNWTHPSTADFACRFERVMLDTVRMLNPHPCVACWIQMNEPNLMTGELAKDQGMALYHALRELDPSRPVIRGSFLADDPTSGDSHNYTGSLNGNSGHYVDIFGTTEKLNTEYGFDAPPTADNLARCPEALRRLASIADRIPEIQRYQYALLKYYTEHYRMQKYAPNAGYVQFLYSDLCPQSFYGLYDYWGLPKQGAQAMAESNQPVGVFLKHSRERAVAVYAINDGMRNLGEVRVRWVASDGQGCVLAQGSGEICLGADEAVCACDLDLCAESGRRVDVALLMLSAGGEVLARNRYVDLFGLPEHVQGHPERMSHELGMRLYFS